MVLPYTIQLRHQQRSQLKPYDICQQDTLNSPTTYVCLCLHISCNTPQASFCKVVNTVIVVWCWHSLIDQSQAFAMYAYAVTYTLSCVAEGRETSGSVPGIYTAQIMSGAPQPDPTVCKCGGKRVFCPVPTCLNMHCVACSNNKPSVRSGFVGCNLALAKKPRRPHQCRVKVMFCKDHAEKHLMTCQDCAEKVCRLDLCHNCYSSFCDSCMSQKDEGSCQYCQKQWAETYANLESR